MDGAAALGEDGLRRMTDLERFLAVCRGERPDYWPIFGFPGAPGMSRGCMAKTHQRLVETGMPAWVDGCAVLGKTTPVAGWMRYWGTTGPVTSDVRFERGARGFRETRRVEGDYEIIESESGAVTRQVIDNDVTYIMPEYVTYPVRDRESWAFYRERTTPTHGAPQDELAGEAQRLTNRDRPLVIGVGGTYGFLRGMFGPERLSLTLYDDPELIHEIMAWRLWRFRTFHLPAIEVLRPEVVQMGEDLCYNHGMLLSPAQFHEFCGAYYRAVCETALATGATLVAVDTDGNAMEFVDVAVSYGVNAIFPFEVKAGNDLFAVRERHPEFVCFGWLEKECVNEGNEAMIEPEIMAKVPPLLEKGRYFPNGDHGIQPLVTFPSMCRFMTLLHEVTGNPEGEFPRVT